MIAQIGNEMAMVAVVGNGIVPDDAPPLPNLRRRAERMAMATPLYWTADMVRQLPDDGRRYETVDGELFVNPAPRLWHQRVVRRLTRSLEDYMKTYPLGEVLQSPADISWAPDVLVQPDVFVAHIDDARTNDWAQVQRLLLAIEVLSPSSKRADRRVKRALYQRVGIPDYWVVDIDARAVERWTRTATAPEILRGTVRWHAAGAAEPLVVDIPPLFAPV